MEKNIKDNKITFWDWKQKIGLFFCVLAILLIIISLILLATASFSNNYDKFFGDGFWSLKHYGLINLFNNWYQLDITAAKQADVSHPFQQVYFAILFLIVIVPILLLFGIILLIRGWWKSRI